MGSWSVYCGISQIAITSGDKCVLLPLKLNPGEYGYTPYLPFTLPIFGEYDDYGGLENIEENENTKLLEEYFGITILDFTKIFTDWVTYQRDEMKPIIKKCKHFDELKNRKFMFIDRNVYDFMSTNLNQEAKGHLDFGDKGILELIGFKYLGENKKNKSRDPKRYKYEWEFDGEKFYSDGTWIENSKRMVIYYYNCWFSDENSLSSIINIPEDKKWIGEKAMWQMWKYVSKGKQKELLGWVIGQRYYDDGGAEELLISLANRLDIKAKETNPELYEKLIKFQRPEPKSLTELYIKNIETFGDGLAELVTIRNNMHCMSGNFAPFIQYLTPQCGEPVDHQILLEKFAEINKAKAIKRGFYEKE
jgi:hypothetical protein